MNVKFCEKYDDNEQEVIVLIQKIWGSSPCDGKVNMLATTIGMVFCKDSTVSIKKGRLNWLVSAEEQNGKKGWNRFKKGQICRILARKLLDIYTPKNIAPEEFNAWYAVKVLEENAVCPQLEEIWNAYMKPVIMEDTVLGTMTLNKEFGMFEGVFKWNGNDISILLEIDENNQSSWEDSCNIAKKMVTEMKKWDKTMRIFSAKELTSLANEWTEYDDENAAPVTEEIFAERISLSELSFSCDNSFTAYYNDDDMFWGHSIEVCGSLDNGVEHANIIG